jgi:hypothetical protein
VVEGARLESVYRPQAYRGFESLPLCKAFQRELGGFFDSIESQACLGERWNQKRISIRKRMVTGFVQDALCG